MILCYINIFGHSLWAEKMGRFTQAAVLEPLFLPLELLLCTLAEAAEFRDVKTIFLRMFWAEIGLKTFME